MGPLFSAVLVLSILALISLVVFGIAKLFLPLGYALPVSLVVVVFGAGGTAAGLLLQAPFLPAVLTSQTQVVSFLSISLFAGIASGVLAGWLVLRLVKPNGNYPPGRAKT